MFIRTNILRRKFANCSINVKSILCKSYCMCFYDIALWKLFTVGSISKFRSCYNKCIKLFFGYRRSSSLTAVLLETGLPSFDTVIFNCRTNFNFCLHQSNNQLVKVFVSRFYASLVVDVSLIGTFICIHVNLLLVVVKLLFSNESRVWAVMPEINQ